MKNFEACKGMNELLGKARARVPAIEQEIASREANQPALDQAAVQSEALEEKQAKQKAALAEENKQAIERLRGELPAAKEKIRLLEEEVKKLTGPAVADIRAKFRPEFAEAIRDLAEKARVAVEAEERVREIRRQAGAMMDEVSSLPYAGVPPIAYFLLSKDGDRVEYSPYQRFLRDVKEAGVKLD